MPLYVVTIPSLGIHGAAATAIKPYASKLFNDWGIGWQDRNYGILLLISKGDRKAHIELGADWEQSYDARAKYVMDNIIAPGLKRGDYAQGIINGVSGLDAMARGLELPKPEVPWWVMPAVSSGTFLILLIIFNLFQSGRGGWAWVLLSALVSVIFSILSILGIGSSSNSSDRSGYTGGGGGSCGD